MCLTLYVGTERPLPATPKLQSLALERVPHEEAPTALQGSAAIFRIGRRIPSEPHGPQGCACAFFDTDDGDSLAAYGALQLLLDQILCDQCEPAGLLGIWEGDERLAPSVEMSVRAEEITHDVQLFSEVVHGWPILLWVSAPADVKQTDATNQRPNQT